MLLKLLEQRAGLQSTNDYNRYAHYASRRAKKLRRREGTSVRPHKKQAHQPPKAPSSWTLAVILAERAWAEAMEAHSALDTAPQTSALRSKTAARLGKAAKYANAAQTLATTLDTGLEKVEVLTYVSLVQLSRAVDRERWTDAVQHGSSARVGLTLLARHTGNEGFVDCIAEVVDPALYLALSHTDRQRTQDVPQTAVAVVSSQETSQLRDVVAQLEPELLHTSTSKPMEELGGQITWRGRYSAKVEDADLAQAILVARKRDEAFEPSSSASDGDLGFDGVLQAWQDAADVAARTLDDSQNSAIVRTYLQYNVLWRRIQRDGLLSDNNEMRTQGTRLLDAVLQSVEELADLPGVHSDEALSEGVEALQAYFTSKRLWALACAYQNANKSREALALVAKASQLLNSAPSTITDLPVTQTQYDSWKDDLALEQTRAHGIAVVAAQLRPSLSDQYVANDLRNWPQFASNADVLRHLVDLEGCVRPVMVKPVFYDVAFNYLDAQDSGPVAETSYEAPSQAPERADPAKPEPAPTPKKKGLFGLF